VFLRVFEAVALLACNSSQPTRTEKVAQKWPRKLEAFANQIVNAPLFISCPRRTSHSDSGQGSLIWELCHVYQRYRCEPHWRTLIDWLEDNGISARKKVHELRKLFGDAIVKQNGIFGKDDFFQSFRVGLRTNRRRNRRIISQLAAHCVKMNIHLHQWRSRPRSLRLEPYPRQQKSPWFLRETAVTTRQKIVEWWNGGPART
jgi:hypothetical protein